MKFSIKKSSEVERLAFNTLFYNDASPICLMENALRWTSGLCDLISSHAEEAALRRNEDSSFHLSPEGISVAAELSRNLVELCRETVKLMHEENDMEIEELVAENDAAPPLHGDNLHLRSKLKTMPHPG